MTLTPPSRSVGTPEAWLRAYVPLLTRPLDDSPGDSCPRARGVGRRASTGKGRGTAALRRGGARAQCGAATRAGAPNRCSLAIHHARTAHYGPPQRTYNASPCGGTGAAHTHERTQRRLLLLWSMHDTHMYDACACAAARPAGLTHTACVQCARTALRGVHCMHTACTLHTRCSSSASAGPELPFGTTPYLLHSSASWGLSCSRRRMTAAAPPRRRARPTHPAPYSTRRHY